MKSHIHFNVDNSFSFQSPNKGIQKTTFKMLFLEIIKCIFIQIHCLFDCVVDFLFGLYYDSKAQKVPPIKNDLVLESTKTLAKKIR